MLGKRLGSALLFISVGLFGCSEDTSDKRADRLYATVSATGEVVVIDDASHDVVKTVKVGAGPAIIVSTPNHEKLYTANWADNTVSVINTSDDTAKNISMAGRPYIIAMSPDGKVVYAGLDTTNEIAVIDIETDKVTRSIPMDELPASLIVSPDSKTLYVAFLGLGITPGKLIAVDPATGKVTKQAVPTGMSPAWITIGKDGSRVYTLNFLSDDVTVVDTENWQVAATVKAEEGSQGIIGNVTPDGKRLYVTNFGTHDLIGIDTATNEIVQTIELDARPVGVQFNEDGSIVYTTDFGPTSLDEPITVGLEYLTSGVYRGTGNGQVRAFKTSDGTEVGSKVVVPGAGATSVVFVPGND